MVEKVSGRLPKHIAIIMDGNGRWAQNKKISRIKGHQQGANALKDVVSAAVDLGIQYLTIFAFSSENWKRPFMEVNGIINLMHKYLKKEISELVDNNIKLNVIGDIKRFPSNVVELLNKAIKATSNNSKLTLTVALNYGARWEIVNAVKEISSLVKEGKVNIDEIDEDFFSSFLSTSTIPDPDLFIRTSGEKRISNFLLWQLSYTELVFLDVLWPDFTKEDMIFAIQEFKNRNRRFGTIK